MLSNRIDHCRERRPEHCAERAGRAASDAEPRRTFGLTTGRPARWAGFGYDRFGSRLCENSEIVSKRRIWNDFLRSAEPVMAENGRKPTEFIDCRPSRSSFHTAWVDGGPSCIVRKSAAVVMLGWTAPDGISRARL
jgi:hypothetical protein